MQVLLLSSRDVPMSHSMSWSNDVRSVVLLVVDSSSIHHYISWVWPILSHCSHDGGSPVIWKFRWVAVEPISDILSPPWLVLNIQLVLETCISIILMSRSWSICWMEEVTSSNSCAFGASCCREFKKGLFCFPWNHPKLVTHVQSILWFDRLITSTPYVFRSIPSHWLICSGKGIKC